TSPPAPKPTPSNSVAAATPGPAQKTQPAVTNGVQGSTTVPNNSASKTAIAVNSNVVQPVATVSKPLRTNSAASSNMVAKAAVSPIPQPTTSLPEPPTPAPQAKTETIVEKSELTPTPQPSAVQEPSVATASSAVIPVPSQPVTETTETQLPKPLPPAQSSTPLATAAAQQLQMPPLVIQFPANATRPSFVRENGKWLLLVALAGAGACFCVFNWLRVVKRPAARRN
ncbi:MAG TPA: hypothetical protein VLT36_00355, partial [Candidatus Dormibacteraeota bacterium]|nr:hypothetical protein [Candidatus Dormibacteraeota bacterium]